MRKQLIITANHILCLYVSTQSPQLFLFVNYIIKVYARNWFEIKSQPSFVRHLYNVIFYCCNLPEEIRLSVHDKLKNNAYFGHIENIIISILTSVNMTKKYAANRILHFEVIHSSNIYQGELIIIT